MKTFIYLSIFLSTTLYSQNAFFDIDIDGTVFNGTWTTGQQTVIKDLLQDVEDAGQTDIVNFDITEYFKSSANASVISSSFVGSDYTNEFKFLFGANISPAVVGDGASPMDLLAGEFQEDVIEGAAASGSIMLGYQFANKGAFIVNAFAAGVEDGDFKLDFKTVGARYRLRLFAKNKESKTPTTINRQTSSTENSNGGYSNNSPPNAQVPATQVVTPTPSVKSPSKSSKSSLIETRVYLQAGLQYNKMTLNYKKPVNLTETSSSGGVNATASFISTLNLDVDISTFSIPVELSGSVRFFRFLNLYAGLGGNLNFGSGSGKATFADSTITVVDNNNTANTATTGVNANLSEDESPAVFIPNLFTGVQLDLWKLKILTQYRFSIGKGVHNIGVSARLAF